MLEHRGRLGLKLKGIGRPCSSTNHSRERGSSTSGWEKDGTDDMQTPSNAVPKQGYGTRKTINDTQTQQLMRRPPHMYSEREFLFQSSIHRHAALVNLGHV